MRGLIEYRFVITLALSGVAGVVGLRAWPFPSDNVYLALVHAESPRLAAAVAYAYGTVWFSTPLLVLNVCGSLLYIFVARLDRPAAPEPLPPYPPPETRTDLFLVVGERHHRTAPTRAQRRPNPESTHRPSTVRVIPTGSEQWFGSETRRAHRCAGRRSVSCATYSECYDHKLRSTVTAGWTRAG